MHPFFWEPTHNYTYTNWLLILHNFAAMKQNILLFFLIFLFLRASAQIPNGYYNTATGSGAALKTQLYNIIKGHDEKSYNYLWTSFQETDKKSNGKVWDMYSDDPNGTPPYEFTFITQQCGSYSSENDCYNREHSWPKSWFNEAAPMNSDMFHLYPTDGYVNNRRDNYPFGEVNSPSWTSLNGSKLGPCSYPGYTGTVFEPIDEYKGDFARTYFYMATRYEDIISGWHSNNTNAEAVLQPNNFPVFEDWFLNMLISWHNADPVSQKEIDRNNVVYTSYQHNRNPYIDHPEYVQQVWGSGATLPEPTNHVASFAAGTPTSTSIPLTWNNNDGAQPADKYLVLINTSGTFSTPADGTPIADDLNLADNSGAYNVLHSAQAFTFSSLTPGTTYYFKIFPYTNYGTNINYKTNEVVPTANAITGNTATLSLSTNTLSGFSYLTGAGPSASQSYTISGAALSPASGSLTVSGSTNYEVSTNNSSFNNTITLNYSSSALPTTTLYVRLKAGAAVGTYTQNISHSGGSASNVNVSCSGSVSGVLPEPTNYPTHFSAHNILLEWNDAEGSVQPDGYLIRMSSVSFADIQAPVDGNTYNSASDFTAPSGQEYIWIKNLTPNTTYYFKLFGYTGSGSGIDYKTDGSVPQVAKQTGL